MTKGPEQQTLTTQQALDLGVEHQNAGRLAEAENVYQQILKGNPNQPVALRLLGTVAYQLGKSEAAVEFITKAITINPNDAEAHNNLGRALRELGQLDAAVASCRRALTITPDLAEAHVFLSLALLLQGNLKEGWEEYEWGLKVEQGKRAPNLPAEMWLGSSLRGKSIIVCAEQGIGDEIMFASCIGDLLERSPDKLFLDCDPRIEALLSRSFPGVIVHGTNRDMDLSWLGENGPPDYSLPIGSLPKFFRNRVEDFPEREAYLTPHPDLVEKWTQRLASLKEGLKIGLSWRGGGVRAAPLSDWQPLLSMDASFINLQYGDISEDIATLGDVHIHDWPDNDPLTDLDSQAALISCLDLVVTIDNATVHMAGALGTRTWLLLEHVPDWRWPEAFSDTSPFYRSIRLFRQKQFFEWGHVMDRVARSLDDLIGNRL